MKLNSKGKRHLALFLSTLAAFWVVSSCLSPSNKEDSFNVGALMPLTGGAAAVGKPCFEGAQLAIHNYNTSRNSDQPEIRLIAEDTQADSALAVSAFHNLTTTTDIKVVIGPMASGAALAVAPLANESKVVILSPSASTPALTDAGDYIFRNELSEEEGAAQQADLAYTTLNYRKIAILSVNNEYGVGTTQTFSRKFVSLGGEIVENQSFAVNTVDFRTPLTRIRSSAPDAVFVVYQVDIINIIKQHSDLGILAPIYTTPVFENPANLEALGDLANGIIYTVYGSFGIDTSNPSNSQFFAEYQERFDSKPTYYSALGYDAGGLLITAAVRSQFDERKIKDELYKIQNFPGLTGVTSFDENGDVSKPVSLKIVRDGKFDVF